MADTPKSTSLSLKIKASVGTHWSIGKSTDGEGLAEMAIAKAYLFEVRRHHTLARALRLSDLLLGVGFGQLGGRATSITPPTTRPINQPVYERLTKVPELLPAFAPSDESLSNWAENRKRRRGCGT
jgi:hypothetical protein